jgi:hypothetical protein
MSTTDEAPKYMSPADFNAKVDWEGGIYDSLEYGLKHTDLDPDDEGSRELREAWQALETVWRDQVKPLGERVEELLEAIDESEGEEDDEADTTSAS